MWVSMAGLGLDLSLGFGFEASLSGRCGPGPSNVELGRAVALESRGGFPENDCLAATLGLQSSPIHSNPLQSSPIHSNPL